MSWERDDHEQPRHDLKVWQLGMRLARQVYAMTEEFPQSERYELASQLRRAATSVPSNIAEGSARRTDRDFLRFLYQARGSLVELDTQMHLAEKLD
ncbi:MAG: four helix bundle protein [Bradymonadaceae bacterium]